MEIMPLISMLFGITILTIAINLIWCAGTKRIVKSDITRISGAAICMFGSGLLLYLEETVLPTFNYIGSSISSHVGLSMSEIIVCIFAVFLIIAYLKTILTN